MQRLPMGQPISCGVFGYPVAEASRIAMRVAREREWDLDEIRFVLFGAVELAAFERALAATAGTAS